MDIKRARITSGILALLTATVVACGSIQGAAGKADLQRGGGANYLTADQTYGIGSGTADSAGGPGAAPSEASGPSLQP
jgi:hypothetical protein